MRAEVYRRRRCDRLHCHLFHARPRHTNSNRSLPHKIGRADGGTVSIIKGRGGSSGGRVSEQWPGVLTIRRMAFATPSRRQAASIIGSYLLFACEGRHGQGCKPLIVSQEYA
jgi:hypothetical protein